MLRGPSRDWRGWGSGIIGLRVAALLVGWIGGLAWPRAHGGDVPRAVIEADRIYMMDESLYTTAGVTGGIDLSLLLEEDFGKTMVQDVAKYLIVYLRRTGGQSQFSPLLEMQADIDSEVTAIQEY